MSEKERIDACLRVVSNRCRNLRKQIDRAKGLEEAASTGQELREEQLECIRGIPRKEALLAELQEILKKQSTVSEIKDEATAKEAPKLSKRAAKAAKAAERANGSQDGSQKSPDASTVGTEEVPTTNGNDSASTHVEAELTSENKRLTEEVEKLNAALSSLKTEQDDRVGQEKSDTVRKILNLSHVADFLREPGSRDVLLKFFESPELNISGASLNGLDMDLLCYFNMMLTSPNGSVPHNSAVDVSTAHCLEYLNASTSDAFEGTSYARLSEIVETIANCSILTDRGLPEQTHAEETATRASQSDGKDEDTDGLLHGQAPGHVVDIAVAEVSRR